MITETSICNSTYEVTDKKSKTIFWQDEKTAIQFMQMPLSKYIVSEINEILEKITSTKGNRCRMWRRKVFKIFKAKMY